jgi:hypothetical protein
MNVWLVREAEPHVAAAERLRTGHRQEGAGVHELPSEAAELRLRELGVEVDVAAVVVVALVEHDALALGVGGSSGNVEGEE